MTRSRQPSAANAPSTAITTPPPVMSRFIVVMLSAVLMESPPVSKVMPLPTSTTRGVRRPLLAGT